MITWKFLLSTRTTIPAMLVVGLLACSPPPRPAKVAEASSVSQSPAIEQARKFAPQACAQADRLLNQANQAYDDGDLAASAILAERAEATYQRAIIQARAAQAIEIERRAKEDQRKFQAQLHANQAEAKRLQADIAQAEKIAKVIQDAPEATKAKKTSPQREGARLKAARSLTLDAAIMCTSASLLGRPATKMKKPLATLEQLQQALAQWPRPAPIDDAYRIRATCLHELTLARRRSDGTGGVGSTDMLLDSLSQHAELPAAHRDDRGVIVPLPTSITNSKLDSYLQTIKKLLQHIPGAVVVIVEHTAPRAKANDRKRVHRAGQHVLEVLGGSGKSKLKLIDAGSARPAVHEPIPPPRPSQNERIELVIVTPTS